MGHMLDGLTFAQRAHVGGMCATAADLAAAQEREACAVLVEKITMQEMLLAGGEMTAGEKRTLKAFQSWIANKIRTRKET